MQFGSGRSSFPSLLKWTLGLSVFIFIGLELWRPCYFLTDDNFSAGFPVITEEGRHLKAGQSLFYSDDLFGGHYNLLRDLEFGIWHPLTLAASLLADTPARFWIIDLQAAVLLLTSVTGFTLLAYRLREEYALPIRDGYLVFYTLSFTFSTFILTVGPSWLGFLTMQSCLPWLTLGILERSPVRSTLLITLFTLHEWLLGYLGLIISGGLCFSAFALIVARNRHSIQPFFAWAAGNAIALLILSPLLLPALDGFGHSLRVHGVSALDSSAFSLPPALFLSSYLLGNWSELIARAMGDTSLRSMLFPYLSTVMACPAAWCIWPAFFGGRWRWLDKLCLGLALALLLLIMRPPWLAGIMYHLPVLRSMRWPFREGLLFLFYIHLLLVLRFPEKPRWQFATAVFSLLVFALPLPFIRVPSLNPLALDRQLVFSGKADAFWTNVKAKLAPGDEIATVIGADYWVRNSRDIPYSLLGTANFPAFFQVRSVSGYSTTAPSDQVPLKTLPHFWFGAFSEEQVPDILAERPALKLIRIESTHPLKITMSSGKGPPVDLSDCLPK